MNSTQSVLLIFFLLLLLAVLIHLLLKHTEARSLLPRFIGWPSHVDDDDEKFRVVDDRTFVSAGQTFETNTEIVKMVDETTKMAIPGMDSLYNNAETLRIGSERYKSTSPMNVSFQALLIKQSSLTSDDEHLENMDADKMSTLHRAQSTDSVDSYCSAFDPLGKPESKLGTLEVRLLYDKSNQSFKLWVLRACELKGFSTTQATLRDFWIVVFLLPHPKPLWRTQLRSGSTNLIQFNEEYQQCIRLKDVPKVALLCQLYSRKNDKCINDANLIGQCRIRLKDINLEQPITIWMAFLPAAQEDNVNYIGELLFSVNYMSASERLTVVILKIRQLISSSDNKLDFSTSKVFIRAYLVQGSRVSKKKTTTKTLVDGTTTFNESMIFSLAQVDFYKVYLRASVIERFSNDEQKSLGIVTIGSRRSGKELGHWRKVGEQSRKPVAMWHGIVGKL